MRLVTHTPAVIMILRPFRVRLFRAEPPADLLSLRASPVGLTTGASCHATPIWLLSQPHLSGAKDPFHM